MGSLNHKKTKLACSLFLLVLCASCVTKFVNSEQHIDNSFRKIFVPSAVDSSTRGGAAGRLTQAIRTALALDTRFQLVTADEARWALDIRVTDQVRRTVSIAECSPTNTVVASQSQACSKLRFDQADTSSETESITLMAHVKAIDLASGRMITKVDFQLPSRAFDVVGPIAVNNSLADRPQLHSLRHFENLDSVVEEIAATIAASVTTSLLSLPPDAFR